MKKSFSFWIKIIIGAIIGIACYFVASISKSPIVLKDTDAKYVSRLQEAPKDGSLPTEHSATDVIAYALWNAANSNYRLETIGETKASIATQKIEIKRVIKDKKATVETISSGFITVAGQKLYADNKVFMRNASKVQGSNVTWSTDAPEVITYNEMIRRVGWLPFQANGYIISDDTILNKDEIKVTKKDNDLYMVSFDLNCGSDYAPFWYRREIIYDTNSTIEPIFKSIHIDLRIDKDYRIVYQNIKESYVVQLYGIKALTTTTLEDHFIYENVEFDEKMMSYFNQYLNVEAKDSNDPIVKEDVASILISSLQNGINDSLFDIDAKIDNKTIKGNASINIYDLKNIKLKLKLDDLFDLEYLDSKIYFSGLGVKLKGELNDLTEIISKINKTGSKALNVEEILKGINNAELIENGINKKININLNIYGIPLNINANVDKIDNNYVLNSLVINTNLLKRNITLNIKKGNTQIKDKDYSSYQQLIKLTPIVNKLLEIVDKKNFDFNFETSLYNVNKELIKLNGNLKLKLYDNNEFDLDLTITFKQEGKDDLNLNIKLLSNTYYKNNNIDSKGMIFISLNPSNDLENQMRIKMLLDDSYSILNTMLKVLGLNIDLFEKYSDFNPNEIDLYQIKNLINIDFSKISNINLNDLIKEFELTDNKLTLKANYNNNLIDIIFDTNKNGNTLAILDLNNLIIKYKSDTDYQKINLHLSSIDNNVIINPDSKEYILINNIPSLLNAFIRTSTLKDFDIEGNLNVDFSLFGSTFKSEIGLKAKVVVDENKKPIIQLNMDLDKVNTVLKSMITTNKLDIYYKDNYVYIKKVLNNNDIYELKVESNKFLKNIKYYLAEFGLGIPNTILSMFNQAQSSKDATINYSKIINSYSYSDNKYNIKLDIGAILKNKNFEILDFDILLNDYIIKDDTDTKVKLVSGIENLKFSIINLIFVKIDNLKIKNVNESKITKVDMSGLYNYINNYKYEVDVIYKNGEKNN